jgi:hypothetical protein
MTLTIYKFGFLALVSICLFFAIPIKKVTAQDYMFCPIFTNGQPASTHCEGSLDDCMRMNNIAGSNGDKVCIPRPKTSSMQN